MMEPAETRQRDNLAAVRVLGASPTRRVLRQSSVRAVLLEIADIPAHDPQQLPFVDGDHVVETLPS